jgi:hypothetical protein
MSAQCCPTPWSDLPRQHVVLIPTSPEPGAARPSPAASKSARFMLSLLDLLDGLDWHCDCSVHCQSMPDHSPSSRVLLGGGPAVRPPSPATCSFGCKIIAARPSPSLGDSHAHDARLVGVCPSSRSRNYLCMRDSAETRTPPPTSLRGSLGANRL